LNGKGRSVSGRSGKALARPSEMNFGDEAAWSKPRSSGAGGRAASSALAATSRLSGNRDRISGFIRDKSGCPKGLSQARIPNRHRVILGYDDDEANEAIRLSWCHLTTEVDWDAVAELIQSLR